MGCEYAVAHAHVATLEAMLDHAHFPPDAPAEILREPNLREALGVNEYKNVRWFNQERYEEMLHWMVFISFRILTAKRPSKYQKISRK